MQRDSLPEWSGCPRRGGRSFAAGIGGGKMDGHGEDRLRGGIFRDGNGLCGGMFGGGSGGMFGGGIGGAAVFGRRHWRRGGIAFRGAV